MKPLNIGAKHGMLTIVGEGGTKKFPSGQTKRLIECKCDCGNKHITYLQKVINGETTSCGCYKKSKPAINKKVLNKGDKVGPFKYIRDTEYKNKKRYIEVECFCGRIKQTTLYVAENSKSCGCHRDSKREKYIAEKSRLISSKRRALKRTTSDNTINIKRIDELLYLQNNSCNICGCDISVKYHIDHIRPISDGGEHSIHNVQLLCQDCNLVKSNGYDW